MNLNEDINRIHQMMGVITEKLDDTAIVLIRKEKKLGVKEELNIKEIVTGKTFVEFAETRGKGADKIATTAEEKGGLALLTWHHFKVKAPYYKKATEGKFDIDAAKKEFEDTYKKISLSMTPIEFQREMGRLEVLGELLIKNKSRI